MKKSKKLLSCAVALASAVSLYTAPVFAQDDPAQPPATDLTDGSTDSDQSADSGTETPKENTSSKPVSDPKVAISSFSPGAPTLTAVENSKRVFSVTPQRYIEYSLKAVNADSDVLVKLKWSSEEGGPTVDPKDYKVEINGEDVSSSEDITLKEQDEEQSGKAVLTIPASLLDSSKPSTIKLAFRAVPSNDPAKTSLDLTSVLEYADKSPRVSGEYSSDSQSWNIRVKLAEKPEFIRLILDKKSSDLLGNPELFKLDDLSINAEVKKDPETGAQVIWIPQSLAQSAKAGSVLTFKIPVHPDSSESKSSSVSLTVEDGHVSKTFKAKVSSEPGAQMPEQPGDDESSTTEKPSTEEGSSTETPENSEKPGDSTETNSSEKDEEKETEKDDSNPEGEDPKENTQEIHETAAIPDTTAHITRENGVTTVTQQVTIPVDQIISGHLNEDGSAYVASVRFQNYTPQQLNINVESYPDIFNKEAAPAVLVNGTQLPAELYALSQTPLENGVDCSVNFTPAGLEQLDPNAQVDVILETAPVDASSLKTKVSVNNGAYITSTDAVRKNETGDTGEEGEKPESNNGVNEETATTSKPFKAQHQYDSDKQTWTVNLTLLRKPQKLVMTFDQQQGTALGRPSTMTLNGAAVSPTVENSGSKYVVTFSAADVARMDTDSKIQLVFPISSTVEQTEKIVMNVDDGNGNKNYSATFRVVRSASGSTSTSNDPKRSDGTSTSTNTGLITTVLVLVTAAAAFIALAFLSRKNRKKSGK